jgi:hypothetical protein
MIKLTARISSGPNKGKELVPKKHMDGKYVASTSRFEIDYLRVDTVEELATLVKGGLSARMYSPEIKGSASLIVSENISIANSSLITPIIEHLNHYITEQGLDRKALVNIRKEQGFLRTFLVAGEKSKECCICSELLPIELLVAAHIKKRSKCTQLEMRDFKRVVGLMCKLGCDDLYEKGYLSAVNGKVVINSKRKTTDFLNIYLTKLDGRAVLNWKDSKVYYDWHANHYLGKNSIINLINSESEYVG